MSEAAAGEKTEEATPKRRQDARADGNIPRSQELTTAAMLLGAAVALSALGPALGAQIREMFGAGLLYAGAGTLDAQGAVALVRGIGWKALFAMGGILLTVSGVALATAAVQARGVITTKPLGPNWGKLNPISNAKQQWGTRSLAELAKSLLKLTLIGLVVRGSLTAAWPELVSLVGQSPYGLVDVIRRYTHRLLLVAGLAYLALAVMDYLYQLWQHEQELRMSKEEIKQESKQSEGDPMVKARMRSMGRALARRQMFTDVPNADVVITNPTHIAVALRYDPTRSDAPVVLAMGQRKVAERIKKIAREGQVPMIENRPLARALLASARVGTTIPPELYMAVAEVLAFVIRSRGTRGAWEGSARA